MANWWDSVKGVVKTTGSAVIAPAGAVVDLAQMPFDDKDDDFGTVMGALSDRTADALELVMGNTVTGHAVSKTLQGMDWLLDNGLNRPISTLTTAAMASSAQQGSSFFDAETWSKAYQLSDNMNAGQALTNMFSQWDFGVANGILGEQIFKGLDREDPLQYNNMYKDRTHPELGNWASVSSWGTNIAGIVVADPAAIALKGAGLGLNAFKYAQMSAAERANLGRILSGDIKDGASKALASRVDNYLDWIGGKNKLNRPLSGPEILAGTPELRTYGADPHVIAGLLNEANGITDVVGRRDVQRRILAVAAGDGSQLKRLREEASEMPALADALTNMGKQSVLDLEHLASVPRLRQNPAFVSHLESQLSRLDGDGAVSRFVDEWSARIEQQTRMSGSLTHAPGVHNKGIRAVDRENDLGKLRSTRAKHDELDERMANWAAKGYASSSSVFQKSRYTMPLLVMKPVSQMAALYTKAPATMGDALRQTHYTGIAHLDEWGPAATQLNSMMRLGEVPQGARMELLSRVYRARTEPEKLRLIEEVENLTLGSVAARYNAKYGERYGVTIDQDYLRTIMEAGHSSRAGSVSSLRGRAYAATEMPKEKGARMDWASDQLRAKNAQKVEDSASNPMARTWDREGARTWRVDQVLDDSGIPVHLPVMSTQLTNTVPLIDVTLVNKVMAREYGKLGRMSKAYRHEANELDRLGKELQAAKLTSRAEKIEKAIAARSAARDWLVDIGQRAMRAWKFSVLFRLGYPVRILMDDHARMWGKMGATAYWSGQAHNFREGTENLVFNKVGRARAAKRQLHAWQEEADEIRTLLNSEQMVAYPERAAELQKITREVGRLEKKAAAGDEKAAEKLADRVAARDYLIAQLGDVSPEDYQRKLETIKAAMAQGKAGAKPDKRRLGDKGFKVGDLEIEGAYAGQYGPLYRDIASSSDTFDHQLRGVEERFVGKAMSGAHTVLEAGKPGHLDAWSDVINHQIRNSPEAMHFLNGGDIDTFVKWVKAPAQADLRRRLPHFAHDPEDWGMRIETMLHDYIPTQALADAVVAGRVTPKGLAKMFPEDYNRPAVHGRAVAETTGMGQGAHMVGNAMNKSMEFLATVPTDRLSRHPFFNAMYRTHTEDLIAVRKAGGQTEFTNKDLSDIANKARRAALKDVRDTLFDMSAHSHAAHVSRFMAPFFAAHQEALMRWFRIWGERPDVIRRIAQVFDAPRQAGIVVDENGEPVKPGELPTADHRILLQLPTGTGLPEEWTNWTIRESAFNLLMPQGPMNPGLGPVVAVPIDWAAKQFADEPSLTRIANVFNPYPSQSTLGSLFPATVKRLSAAVYAETGVDPSLIGIGRDEYNDAWAMEVKDRTVEFQLKEGREPTQAERDKILKDAGAEAGSRMWHRFLWNAGSPAPATPQSRYAAIQQGWYQIQEQARAEGKDFDWAYERFRDKYSDAYLPLIHSSNNNPAGIDTSNPAWASAVKQYRGTLDKVDPALSRMVVGAYVNEIIEGDGEMGEYSIQSRNYLRGVETQPGTGQMYYSDDDPALAMEEAQSRRGWAKFNALTAGLDAQAEQMGLASYEDSDELVAIKRAAVDQLKAENDAWAAEYGAVDSTKYDRYVDDMRQVVADPALANDPTRTDIATLEKYIAVRDAFVTYFEASLAAGTGGPDSAAQARVRLLYTGIVDQMVRENTMFQAHMYDGLIERDPLLMREAA